MVILKRLKDKTYALTAQCGQMRKNQLVTDHFHCITILAGQPAQKTHVGFSILGHPVDSDGLNAAHQFQSVLSGNPPRN